MKHTAGSWGRRSRYPAVLGGGRCWYCCCWSPKNPNPWPPNNPPPAVWPKKLPSGRVKNGSLKKGSLSNTSKMLLPRPNPPPPMPNPMPKLANGSGNPPNRPAPSRRLPRPPDAISSLNLAKFGLPMNGFPHPIQGARWCNLRRCSMDGIIIGAAIRVANIGGLQVERERGKRESQKRRSRRRLEFKPSVRHVVVPCSPLVPHRKRRASHTIFSGSPFLWGSFYTGKCN